MADALMRLLMLFIIRLRLRDWIRRAWIKLEWTRLLVPLCGSLLTWSCALNPATGRQDFVLLSEQDEVDLGRENHAQITERYGVYSDRALAAYVQEIGARMAEHSHRTSLIYRFTVLDSPEVNAFALPGGYIYITRGLLAYLNSEAELAAVLGHEIGHVTARHAIRQHSAATATGLLGAVLAAGIGVAGAGDLANILGTALVRGYGREHELEADRLGAEYLARAGYDPKAMIEVIDVLKDQEQFELDRALREGREPRAYHGVFATHPANDARLQEVVAAAEGLTRASTRGPQIQPFLARIEDLVFGDSARDGIRRGHRFYHDELGFALDFPPGWIIENQQRQVLARAPGNAALLELSSEDLNQRLSPEGFLKIRLKLDVEEGRAYTAQGLSGYTGVTRGRTPWGYRSLRIAVVYLDQRAYLLVGAAQEDEGRFDAAFIAAAQSFRPLSAAERVLAEPQHIGLIEAPADARIATLAARSAIPNDPEAQLRLLNGLYPDGEPKPGQLFKVVE